MITAAQAIVDCLRREGIDHVFGIPGTMNLPILDVLRSTPEIRFVLTRHEQGAAFMAYGFARTLNRPAIVTATEGPGVTNLITGIGAAYKGHVPVISISGAQDMWIREKSASQDIDQVTMHLPITKWAYSIPSPTKAQVFRRRISAGCSAGSSGCRPSRPRAKARPASGSPSSNALLTCMGAMWRLTALDPDTDRRLRLDCRPQRCHDPEPAHHHRR